MADDIEITPALTRFFGAVLGEGMTYEQIRDRGGPSQPTLTKILKGEGGSISAKSAQRLEDAIDLVRGSIRIIAFGGRAKWKPATGDRHPAEVEAQEKIDDPVARSAFLALVRKVERYEELTDSERVAMQTAREEMQLASLAERIQELPREQRLKVSDFVDDLMDLRVQNWLYLHGVPPVPERDDYPEIYDLPDLWELADRMSPEEGDSFRQVLIRRNWPRDQASLREEFDLASRTGSIPTNPALGGQQSAGEENQDEDNAD